MGAVAAPGVTANKIMPRTACTEHPAETRLIRICLFLWLEWQTRIDQLEDPEFLFEYAILPRQNAKKNSNDARIE